MYHNCGRKFFFTLLSVIKTNLNPDGVSIWCKVNVLVESVTNISWMYHYYDLCLVKEANQAIKPLEQDGVHVPRGEKNFLLLFSFLLFSFLLWSSTNRISFYASHIKSAAFIISSSISIYLFIGRGRGRTDRRRQNKRESLWAI